MYIYTHSYIHQYMCMPPQPANPPGMTRGRCQRCRQPAARVPPNYSNAAAKLPPGCRQAAAKLSPGSRQAAAKLPP